MKIATAIISIPQFENANEINFHQFSLFFQFFHVHGPDLNPVQSFYQIFFRSSYLQNLNLRIQLWGWTKGKRKLTSDFRAHNQNVKKVNQKKSGQDSAHLPPATESSIALQASFKKPSLQAILNTYYKYKSLRISKPAWPKT